MAKDYFIHPSTCVDEPVTIGAGTHIWHFCHLMPDAQIGQNCNLGQNVYVDRGVVIGDGCKIQNNVSIYKGVTLEDGVFCGPSMVFTNVVNPRSFIDRRHEFQETRVRKGGFAGSQLNHRLRRRNRRVRPHWRWSSRNSRRASLRADNSAYRGSKMGWACRCGVTLGDDLICAECGAGYEEAAGRAATTELRVRDPRFAALLTTFLPLPYVF